MPCSYLRSLQSSLRALQRVDCLPVLRINALLLEHDRHYDALYRGNVLYDVRL